MDSFSLYCLAAEIEPAETLRVLGLIEARLLADPERPDNRMYKGALLARLGQSLTDFDQSRRFIVTGLNLMRDIQPTLRFGAVVQLQTLYAHSTTIATLPCPPVTTFEAAKGISTLVEHPGFHRLHPLRRENAISINERILTCGASRSRRPI